MNARQMTLRDPAMAALLGYAHINGADFGKQASFGDDGYGFGGFGEDPSALFAAGFGGVPPSPAHAALARKPTAHEAVNAWHAHNLKKAHGMSRIMHLDPNMHSDVKVEKYTFQMSQTMTWGTATAFDTNLSQTPSTTFRPKLLTSNVPAPTVATISTLQMANVNVFVGPGKVDAWSFNSLSWGRDLDMPTLSPSNRASFNGTTTTFVPPGYVGGQTWDLCFDFKGPSLLAGGGSLGIGQ